MNRSVTTLFLLTSVDGKISTGSVDELDVDIDFPKITGIKEGFINTMKYKTKWIYGLLIAEE